MSSVPYRQIAIGTSALCLVLIVGLAYVGFQSNSTATQLADVTKVANLEKTYVWIDHQTVNQPSRQFTEWNFTTDYAGYVSIEVTSSTTENTYVQLSYSSHGVSYDSGKMSVGSAGTASFPVLPGIVTIHVGNTNLVNGATEIVTATLYY